MDDLRDIFYAGDGNDSFDAGAGNDLVFGQGGNDPIAGGFGVDEIQGQVRGDVITGSTFSDLVFGGAGNEFVSGGFGQDRINGCTGAYKFFHVVVEGHGSDWVQDCNSAEGDVLLFGNTAATRADLQLNFVHIENAEGERAGDDNVVEAFVIYRPMGQIIWALVDGRGQSSINLQIGADVFGPLTLGQARTSRDRPVSAGPGKRTLTGSFPDPRNKDQASKSIVAPVIASRRFSSVRSAPSTRAQMVAPVG